MVMFIYRVQCLVPGSESREVRIPAQSTSDAERIAKDLYGAVAAWVTGSDGPYTGFGSLDDAEDRHDQE